MSAKRSRKQDRETAAPEALRLGEGALKKDCETTSSETLRLGDDAEKADGEAAPVLRSFTAKDEVPETGKKDLETAKPEALRPGGKTGKRKKKKKPVRKGAVWWPRGEGHPMLKFFGAELKSQRDEKRGWTLDDLHDASGLCKSFLSDLENDKSQPTAEVILELEMAFGMKPGALMDMTRRRWKNELQKPGMMEKLLHQLRQLRRAWRREALAAWLGSLFPLENEVPCEGLAG